jgi:hypothetical protein
MHTRSKVSRARAAAWILGIGLSGSSAAASSITLSYTGSIVTYTIPTSGVYQITAAGGQGGAGGVVLFNPLPSGVGGLGSLAIGDISLTAGTILDIVVGGMGLPGIFAGEGGGGGGGGSFVFVVGATTPLVVAGGGGGGGFGFPGGSGQTTTSGESVPESPGGTGGMGGSGGSGGYSGGGGGGWLGNGTNGGAGDCEGASEGGRGGSGPPTFTGGMGVGVEPECANGGFGGGGGGGEAGGGGGGGYPGGGSGSTIDADSLGGGGGGSFIADTLFDTSLTGGINGGNGFVTISTAVPEPRSFALLGLGLIGLALLRRKI